MLMLAWLLMLMFTRLLLTILLAHCFVDGGVVTTVDFDADTSVDAVFDNTDLVDAKVEAVVASSCCCWHCC